ncbi:hypothetical protein ACQ4LE_008099 [Meloidogyne hapla]|uniref:DEK_C domain-containing protein n=1 Tax=Meloidogyne hapla TaxID=6305 RepID=A0A1I8BIV2_MELHA
MSPKKANSEAKPASSSEAKVETREAKAAADSKEVKTNKKRNKRKNNKSKQAVKFEDKAVQVKIGVDSSKKSSPEEQSPKSDSSGSNKSPPQKKAVNLGDHEENCLFKEILVECIEEQNRREQTHVTITRTELKNWRGMEEEYNKLKKFRFLVKIDDVMLHGMEELMKNDAEHFYKKIGELLEEELNFTLVKRKKKNASAEEKIFSEKIF